MIFYIQNDILIYTPQGKLIKLFIKVIHEPKRWSAKSQII